MRRAASGLSRVLPLAYAGSPPSGTRRELARALGVSAGERDELAQTVAAVLDRDPAAVAAVRERLSARRDAAAAALAFEFAARLQAELEALAWVTAEQKVTTATPDDLDVCGWADGLLIRFTIRRGRLSGWIQRACGAAAGRRLVAATPPEWAGSPTATPNWRPGSFPRSVPRAETTATACSDFESSFGNRTSRAS